MSVFGKLLMATLLGGAIGIEREIAGKPAGLRTNILICVGAALFAQLSLDVARSGFGPDGRPFGDPGRIAAQIIVGVGFLGAGAIVHGGGVIVGLTTAATIWAVAAIGVAIGVGAYVDALGATALIMVVLVGLRPVESALLRKRRRVHATLRVKAGAAYEPFEAVIRDMGIHIFDSKTYEHSTDRTFELDLVGPAKQFDLMCNSLRTRSDVISITTD